MAPVRPPRLTLVDEGMLPFAYDEPELSPEPGRPETRADCAEGLRPCPWISCRYHLVHVDEGKVTKVLGLGLLTSAERGSADEAAWVEDVAQAITEMSAPSCALDVAASANGDEKTLQEVGDALGVTRERIRQLELSGLGRARRSERLLR